MTSKFLILVKKDFCSSFKLGFFLLLILYLNRLFVSMVNRKCIITGCNKPKQHGVSVHRFPTARFYKEIWINFVRQNRPNFQSPSFSSYLCSDHFTEDMFQATSLTNRPQLINTAIPTLLEPSLKAKTGKRKKKSKTITCSRYWDRDDDDDYYDKYYANLLVDDDDDEKSTTSAAAVVYIDNDWIKEEHKPTINLNLLDNKAGPSNQGYTGKPETSRRKKIATATVSSETVLIPDDSPPQPTAPKLQKKQIDDRRFDERRFEEQQRFQERRFENRRFDERRQQMAAAVQSAQVAAPSLQIPPQMQVKQHLQVAPPPPPPLQAPRQVQVLAPPPVQVPVPKPKPVEKPRPREKRIFVVADHQRCVMSNLASLWKSGKLCDAGIGNGSSTVMVHKVVLSAVCPKLLSVFSTDILSHKFLQVNFPEEVSTEALNAFAEYMYNGILDLDPDILQQLKIIAKRLDMKEFEQLCDSHLPNQHHQPVAAAATSSISFNNLPLIQTSVPIIPSIPTSHQTSLSSLNISSLPSVPSITTQVIDVKQEISEAELDQVKKDTAAVFGEESQVVSLAPNQSGNAGFVISPSIKTEPIGPEDDKYGRLGAVGKTNSSNNQVYTSSSSSISAVPSSSISSLSTAAFVPPSSSSLTSSSILSSIPTSSTEYAIPFTDTIDIKTTELKLTPTTASTTYVTPSLMPDLSSVTSIVEAVCSQPSAMNEEDSTKPLTQQQPSLSAMSSSSSALEGPSLSSSGHDNIYPVGLFTAEGDNLPLLTTQTVGIKTIDLYKTDLT